MDHSPLKPKRGRLNVNSPNVVQAIDTAKLSSPQAAVVISAVASTLGVSVEETNVNVKTIQLRRDRCRNEIVEKLKEEFKPDPILTVHWDGKIVQKLDSKDPQDRQAIIVTGETTAQLLGCPKVPNGTAQAIKTVVTEKVEEWGILQNIKALSFDTTTVNSGALGGAAVLIEQTLDREMIWLPCRHHIFERIIEGVFLEVMGPSMGPDPPIFKILENKWKTIDKSKFVTYKDYADSRKHLDSCVADTIEFAKKEIAAKQPRADYLELLQLTIIFLGGMPPKGEVSFRKPGAKCSARWMAKNLYVLKMCLFRKQLALSQNEASRLFSIAIFIVRVYVRAWFTCTDSIASPRHDLHLMQLLLNYEKVNKRIALAAQAKFENHLWYLSEISIGFAVFDEHLPCKERDKIVHNIQENHVGDEPSRRRQIHWRNVPSIQLSDLVTTNTGRFFSILNLDIGFFSLPATEWAGREDYQKSKNIVRNLHVVNDHAERMVKLMTDFNKSVTVREEQYQQVLLTTHALRKSLPDKKKGTLLNKYHK